MVSQNSILMVSTICLIAAVGLAFDSCRHIFFDDNNSLEGIFLLILNIYGVIKSLIIMTTEFSMSIGQDTAVCGSRIAEYLPFLRSRYGRPVYYMVSGIFMQIFNSS